MKAPASLQMTENKKSAPKKKEKNGVCVPGENTSGQVSFSAQRPTPFTANRKSTKPASSEAQPSFPSSTSSRAMTTSGSPPKRGSKREARSSAPCVLRISANLSWRPLCGCSLRKTSSRRRREIELRTLRRRPKAKPAKETARHPPNPLDSCAWAWENRSVWAPWKCASPKAA